MKLERIDFDEFKSISKSSLDVEAGITTLVGINESGKSNVLNAIEKAGKGKKLDNLDITRGSERAYDDGASPKLTLSFRLDDKESEALKGAFGVDDPKKLTRLVLVKSGDLYSLNYPKVQYEKSTLTPTTGIVADRKPVEAAELALKQHTDAVAAKKAELAASAPEAKPAIATALKTLEDGITPLRDAQKAAQDALTIDEAEKTKERQAKVRILLVDKILKDHMPKILFFDSVAINDFYLPLDGRVEIEKLISSPAKHKPIINLLALGGIVDPQVLVGGAPKKNDLRAQRLKQASSKINSEILRKHWPLQDVEFELSIEETGLLAIRLHEKGSDSTFIPEDRSRGLQWSVAFNIYFLSESSEARAGELRNAILLVDEPGVFLHVDAQKKLLEETFPKILKGNNQIIYTTHLPYLIDPKYPERIRILERLDSGGETMIGNKAWSEGRVGDIPEPVKTALGTKWTEWFGMADRSAFVEGPSDQVLLRTLVGKVGSDINFIPAYGKTAIPSALAISRLDEKSSVGIIDNDSTEEEYELLQHKLSLVNLPPEALTNVAALAEEEGVVTVEDLIPESVYRKALCGVYSHTFEKAGVDLKEEEIPTEYPRIAKWEKFVEQKLGEKGVNFKKMEVAREVADEVNRMGDLAPNAPKWTQVRKVAKALEALLEDRVLLEEKTKEEAKKEK